jgi:hypothetical protein
MDRFENNYEAFNNYAAFYCAEKFLFSCRVKERPGVDTAAPFAVIYSGEQPGSAAGFAVMSPFVWQESKDFRGGGGVPGCSFAVFNSEISDRRSLLSTRGEAPSRLSDRPRRTSTAVRLLVRWRFCPEPCWRGIWR